MASDGSPVIDTQEKQKTKQKQRLDDDGRSSDRAEAKTNDDEEDGRCLENCVEEETDVELQIQRLTKAGHSALQSGDNHAALQHFKSAFSSASKLGARRVSRTCALNLGAAYVEAGNAEKGLRVLQRQGSSGRVADLQFNLGTALEALGRFREAKEHYQQAVQLYRAQGDARGEGEAYCRLGRCQMKREEYMDAVQSLIRAAESYNSSGNSSEAALALRDAGKVMLQSGNGSSEEILNVLTDSLELSNHITHSETRGKLLNTLGLLFSQMSLSSEAVECFQQALSLLSGNTHTLAVVLQNLGATHNTLGEFQKALSFHREAAKLHGALGRRAAQGRCFSNLGFALMELGEIEEARESYMHSLLAFRDSDDSWGQCEVCEALGVIRLQMRDPERAVLHYQEALRLLSRCQEVNSSVQERLVNKLSEALHHKLILQQREAVAQRRHTRRLPGKAARRPDVQHLQRLTINNGEKIRADRNHAFSSSEPNQCEEQEQEDYQNTLPEANRNLNNTHDEADMCQQMISSEPEHGESSLESGSQRLKQMNGAHPLVKDTAETPLPARQEATPQWKRLKSRFCSVM